MTTDRPTVSSLARDFGIVGPACCVTCGFEIVQRTPLVAHMHRCAGPFLAPRAKKLREQHLARLVAA